MYLLETVISHPSHSLYQSKADALSIASCLLRAWAIAIFKGRCNPEAANQVTALLADDRCTEAMEAWNAAHDKPSMCLREIEMLDRNCHHSEDAPAREDEYFVVEPALDGVGAAYLFDTIFAALEQAAGILREWTSRNPIYAYPCNERTRQKVRHLVHKNEIADAIDAWMADDPNPTIAIHKIRVCKKECRNEEPENPLPLCC